MDKELKQFKEDGLLVVRKAFSAEEITRFINELDSVLEKIDAVPTARYRTAPWNPDLVERIDPLSPYSEVFASINKDNRINDRMQKFFPQQNGKHFKDKLIFKAPQQAGYGPHQDQSWWITCGEITITCFLALDPACACNGGLQLLKGSHHTLLTNPDEPRFLTETDLQKFDSKAWYLPELKPGDIVFFHGQTVHRSDSNNSTCWRRTYFTSYCN